MTGPRRRAAALAAVLSVGALAATPQAALADVLAPDSPASSAGDASRTAYFLFGGVVVLVIVGIIAALVATLRGGGGADAAPERRTRAGRGVQRRVVMGLAAGALVLFVVGIVFAEKVRSVEASTSGADPITIDVTGQQWLWRYDYPEAEESADGYSTDTPYSYYDLVVPVDTPITLDVTSIDVLHRWWVPALTRAVEAVPEDTNSVTFTADEVGIYEGRSTEFSGPAYPAMRTRVQVVEPDDYDAFLKQRIAEIKAARAAVQEKVANGTAPGVALER